MKPQRQMKRWTDYIGLWCGTLIVNDKDEVLLLKRTDKTQWGGWWLWSRPWGAVEFGEPIEDAIKREIKEELNIEVELFGPRLYADDIREENGDTRHRFIGGRFSRIIWWEVKNMEPEKHAEVKRFHIDNLPANLNEYTRQAIVEFKAYKNLFM